MKIIKSRAGTVPAQYYLNLRIHGIDKMDAIATMACYANVDKCIKLQYQSVKMLAEKTYNN